MPLLLVLHLEISAVGTSFTVVGLPVGASLGIVNTESSGVGGDFVINIKKV